MPSVARIKAVVKSTDGGKILKQIQLSTIDILQLGFF